jgi:branched-chain amino acid transport system substrate-binding protein
MKLTRSGAIVSCCAALVLALPACGDDDDSGEGGNAQGETLNIYSSMPLQGAQRPNTTDLVRGAQLALKQHGGKSGGFTIDYTSLDDSTAQAGTWTPEQTSANARKVAQDDSAVAYIGEFNSGASAISIPILNEVPIAQVSPANTAVGLTSDDPGADEGEPEKYYPSGQRHYLRIVPKDTIQGAALAAVMKKDGCQKAYILNDKEVYGAGLARNIEMSAKEQGLEILANEGIDPKAPNFRSLAAKMKGEGADCFVFGGITANGARCSSTRTCSPRTPTSSCTDPTGSPRPGSRIPGRAASRPTCSRR